MSEAPVKTDTVSIEVDGVTMEVPKGSMIIEAADKAGITIPRFCYHPRLSIAANCRMCLVDVEKAPKPLPACATPVMDGMKVYTESRRAISAQQNVMEFLLINHPLDCPICDQGGECELQDVSMGFGRSISRFTERKRVVKDENLGSLIATDMTRCIHCTRCVRFLDEVAGTNELGGMGRGETTFISTFIERSIDSELSGNIIDLCPVGALTNKPYRYRARAWELRARPAIANHDSIGSNLHFHLKRGRIMRAVPRENEAVNESWLADRDRWGFHGLYSDDRATAPAVKVDGGWQQVPWAQALDRAAEALREVAGDELGVLLSPRASNEELYLAQKLARALGSHHIDHRLRERDLSDQAGLPLAPGMGLPLTDINRIDAALLVACNARQEQPILGHRLRQAWRAGAAISRIGSRRCSSHFDPAVDVVVRPSQVAGQLAAVASALGATGSGRVAELISGAEPDDDTRRIAEQLKQAESGTVILGQTGVCADNAALLRALCHAISDAAGVRYSEPPVAANSAGAWRVGAVPHRLAGGGDDEQAGLHARDMLAQPRKAYLLFDFEPSLDLAEGRAGAETLAAAQLVIYAGAYCTPEIEEMADVVLPVAPLPEAEGSLTNADGLTQVSLAAARPPGEARPGWKIFKALADRLQLDGFDFVSVDQVRAEIADNVPAGESPVYRQGDLAAAAEEADGDLETVSELPIYSVDAVVRRSSHLQQTSLAENGELAVHPSDLTNAGLEAGAAIAQAGGRQVPVQVRADDSLAPGTVRIAEATLTGALLAGTSALTLKPSQESDSDG